MARTRSTRKTTTRKTNARKASPRGRAAAKKTTASSRGAPKAKATAKSKGNASQGDAEFRAEVDDLVSKLTSTRRPWSLRRARQEFERSYVNHIIRRSDMDRQRAATRLDIGFSTLKEKIRAPGKR
jgi:DNA-binding NtrC family response regulator